jgi:hypothetical protein
VNAAASTSGDIDRENLKRLHVAYHDRLAQLGKRVERIAVTPAMTPADVAEAVAAVT